MPGPSTGAERAAFITIEGPEGAGKTSQAERLRASLLAAGRAAILTREPGGTWLGERLRDLLLARQGATPATARIDPLTDAFLFNAARRQLVEEVIQPALGGGTVVVCARFTDSTLAYQGYGAGVPLAALRDLASVATGGLVPDLTVLLDLPAEAGLARKRPEDQTRFEAEFDLAFHRRVRAGFLELAVADPERWVVVDATRSRDDVAAAVVRAVHARLPADEPSSPIMRTTG